jgi:hypothetical protein
MTLVKQSSAFLFAALACCIGISAPILSAKTKSLTIADLNGDGRPDILTEGNDGYFYWNKNELVLIPELTPRGWMTVSHGWQWTYITTYTTSGSIQKRRLLFPTPISVTIKLEGDENPAVGSVTGTEEINLGSDYTLTAGSQGGYVFERWSGDLASDQNPIGGTLQSPLTLTAHYVKDMGDSDGDGLSNYREYVELGTNADSNDTDADGLFDKEEVEDIGSSPLDSDKVIVDYLRGQATVTLQATEALHQAEMEAEKLSSYESGRDLGFEEGNESGILFVANNPAHYNLFTETELNSSVEQATHEGRTVGFEEGNQSGVLFVANNPERYDLFTETQLDASVAQATADGRNAGITTGEQRVVSDPKTYSLVSKSDYDSMVQELIELSDNNSTPYTSGWFYISSRNWIYTNKEIFPYFFDSSTGGWMFFRSGFDRPTFYHYGKKEWITLDE